MDRRWPDLCEVCTTMQYSHAQPCAQEATMQPASSWSRELNWWHDACRMCSALRKFHEYLKERGALLATQCCFNNGLIDSLCNSPRRRPNGFDSKLCSHRGSQGLRCICRDFAQHDWWRLVTALQLSSRSLRSALGKRKPRCLWYRSMHPQRHAVRKP